MSTNKDVVKGLLEGVWSGKAAAAAAIAKYRSDDCVSHFLSAEPLRGRADYYRFIDLAYSRFEQSRMQVLDMIEEGNRVAFRAVFRGTTREGKRIEMNGFGIARVENGKVVEGWNGWDSHALAASLSGEPTTLEGLLSAAL